KVRTSTTQTSPRAIAHRTDDRLHDQTGERRGEPKNRQSVGICTELFVDAAHIAELQTPAKLNPEKSETHVPDLPEAQAWFIHRRSHEDLIAGEDRCRTFRQTHLQLAVIDSYFLTDAELIPN